MTGTAVEAARRQATAAVVIVHEFRTDSADRENLSVNTEDFQSFVSTLLGLAPDEAVHGQLYGPAQFGPSAHLDRPVDVFIGKAVFDWHQPLGLPNQPIEPTGFAGGS